MSEKYLEIKLKKNWDYPQSYRIDEISGVFQGRIDECDKIRDIILRKPKSSILICGPRGKGKTSLIYKILREIGRGENFLVPVIINAAQLGIEDDAGSSINYLAVLENIIRRLYVSLCDELKTIIRLSCRRIYKIKFLYRLWRFKRRASKLYKKSLAIGWEKLEKKEKINKLFIGWKVILSAPLVFLFAALVYNYFYQKNTVFYIAIPISFLINLFFLWRKSSGELYRFDKNLSNLEHDFHELFRKSYGLNITFIIDELEYLIIDKKGNQDTARCEKITLPLIKSYKNLFHFIPTTFCFVGDDLIYSKIVEENGGGIFSTLFTEIFYLSYPKQKDLFIFFDELKEENQEINRERWGLFRNYLMFEAKGDFRKSIQVVKDYLKFKDRYPYLSIDKDDFDSKKFIQAKIYKLLCQIYDYSLFVKPRETYKNENFLNGLYEIINPSVWIPGGYQFRFSTDNIIKKYQEYFIQFLKEQQIISTEELKGDGTIIVIRGNPNVIEIPDSITKLMPHEKELEDIYNNFKKELDNYREKLNLGDNYFHWLSTKTNTAIIPILDNIKQKFNEIEPRSDGKIGLTLSREETNKLKEELSSIDNVLNAQHFDLLKTRIIEENDSLNVTTLSENVQIFNLLPSLREKLAAIKHVVLYLPNDFSKQLIIVDSQYDAIKEDNKMINENGLNFSYKIINTENNITSVNKWLGNYKFKYFDYEWFVVSGIPQIRDNKLVLNKVDNTQKDNSGHRNTFLIIFNNKKFISGTIDAEVQIDKDSLVNIVVGYNKKDDGSDRFWISRLDTRPNETEGIAFKNYNANWEAPQKRLKKKTEAEKLVKVKVKFNKKGIKLYRDKFKMAIDLFRDKIDEGNIGIFNEVGKVEISSIRINIEE